MWIFAVISLLESFCWIYLTERESDSVAVRNPESPSPSPLLPPQDSDTSIQTIFSSDHMMRLLDSEESKYVQFWSVLSFAPDNQRGSWMTCWNVQMLKCLAVHHNPMCTLANCLEREGDVDSTILMLIAVVSCNKNLECYGENSKIWHFEAGSRKIF